MDTITFHDNKIITVSQNDGQLVLEILEREKLPKEFMYAFKDLAAVQLFASTVAALKKETHEQST